MTVYLRVALAASFLSAVGDRYGMWGPFGTPNVSWGDFGRFVAYAGKLNWFVPEGLWPLLAVLSTAAEVELGPAVAVRVVDPHRGHLQRAAAGPFLGWGWPSASAPRRPCPPRSGAPPPVPA